MLRLCALKLSFVMGLIALFLNTIPTAASANVDYMAWPHLSEKGTHAMNNKRYDYAEICFWASIQSLSPYPASATKDYQLYHSYAQLASIYKIRNNPVDELRCRFAANWHQFWGYAVAVGPIKAGELLPYFLIILAALETIFAAAVGIREGNRHDVAAGTQHPASI